MYPFLYVCDLDTKKTKQYDLMAEHMLFYIWCIILHMNTAPIVENIFLAATLCYISVGI